MKTCVECATPLTGRQAKYCGTTCASKVFGKQRVADGRMREYRKRQAAQIAAYNKTRRVERQCVGCGERWMAKRPDAKYCSGLCRLYVKHGGAYYCALRPQPATIDSACVDCGEAFTTTSQLRRYCTARCQQRVKDRRRTARLHKATGTYTWAEVTRLFLAFGRCCAYCRQPVNGAPEPDHVVALSRGGSNSLSNILPSCPACNADKSDLTLDEWARQRARLNKPTVVTSWPIADVKYQHLALPTRVATQHRYAS